MAVAEAVAVAAAPSAASRLWAHRSFRLGLLLFGLVVLAERLLIPWHVSQRAPVQGTI